MERTTKDYLDIIERTRLLYNTLGELGEVAEYSVKSGNGLSRKGGNSVFLKNAVLHELAYLAREHTDLDLEEVLDVYIDCDALMERYGRVLQKQSVCQQLIRNFYADGEASDMLRPVVAKMGSEHVPILVLMVLKVLPRLSAKDGDVKDIKGDYERTFSFLYSTCQAVNLQTIPTLSELEGEVRRNPEVMCRFHLIGVMNTALIAYSSLSTPENLSRTNAEERARQFIPDLSGIWVEEEPSTMFWQFEEIANGHYLRQYTLDNEHRIMTYTEYHIRFMDEGEEVLAIVMHPQLVRDIVQNVPIPPEHAAYLTCSIEEDCLYFEPRTTDSRWLHLRQLTRSKQEVFFQHCLDDEHYTKTNRFADDEYTFRLCLHTITEDALFFEMEEEGSLLRVPKSMHPQLPDVHFGENAGLLRFKDSLYLALDDRHLYFEITTRRQRKKLGITSCKEHSEPWRDYREAEGDHCRPSGGE